MEIVTDFIELCCTERENADALVPRAVDSIMKYGTTILNILGFQKKVIARDTNAPLLTPTEMVELLDKTDALGAQLPAIIEGCADLTVLLGKAKVYGVQRTEVPIDETVKQAVIKEVNKQTQGFKNEYSKLTVLSNKVAQENYEYRTDPAQVFMAAWCMSAAPYTTIAIAPPAAGKTYAFLLLAARYLEMDETEQHRVVIYVNSQIVKK